MTRPAKIRSDLIAVPAEIDGAVVYNIKDPITGSYFRLRQPEYWLINQLDGATAYTDIARKFNDKFGANLTADAVGQFVQVLGKLFFLDDGRAEQAVSRVSYDAARGEGKLSRFLFIKIKAFNPGRFLDGLTRLYSPFHNRFGAALAAVILTLGLGLLLANSVYFYIDLGEIFNVSSLAMVILGLFVIVSIHEFAHAVICRYFGGEVREIGFLLLYFQPCFYSDLSDAWLFPNRSHRLAVTWAGPAMQLLLLALAVIFWRITVPGSFPNEVARLVAVVCWVTMLFNFNPLIKLDGYYLLSDWVDIPNLRRKSFAYLGNVGKRVILGWPIPTLETTARQRRIYLNYAILAVAYSTFLLLYLLVIVAQFLLAKLGGWGLLVLAVVLVSVMRSGLVALFYGTIKHLGYMKQTFKNRLRLLVWLLALASLGYGLFGISFPHRVSGEISIQPIKEFTLLLNEFGLLESRSQHRGINPETKTGYLQMTSNEMATLDLIPLVKDGEIVESSDALAILVSNQVTKEIIGNIAELDKFKSQLALLQSPPKQEEIDEAQTQVEAARVGMERLTRNLARTTDLVEKNLATREDYETAVSEVDIALAELANRKARLQLLTSPPKREEEAVIQAEIDKQEAKVKFLREQEEAQSIMAPFAGEVVVGTGGDCILTVLNSKQVIVQLPVSDFDLNLIETGQSVELKMRTYPDRTYDGTVVHIPRTANLHNQQAWFPVSIEVANEDGSLQKGMTGFAKIGIAQRSVAELTSRKIKSFVRVEFWSWW
ncbi:MAG: HlyD family efflux transporter periplasmic adaptor subunit [candidate division Zixibacteria bacterium]|nr:HlyD family efflux transporter periplasmic adaptor subunit [candidate division Zixibacteria bacterium]